MRWQTKARAFNALSVIPFGSSLHFLLQRYVTRRLPRPEKQVTAIYGRAQKLLEQYAVYGARTVDTSTFFEFGSGRDLVVPWLSAHAAPSASSQWTSSVSPSSISSNRTPLVVAKLSDLSRPAFSSWEELERYWSMDYRAPADARATGMESNTIDCAVSVETLEHIPKDDILNILKELRRILRPDGIALMQIDYGDHFKGFDPSISSFNFLTYSEEDWRPFQSRFQYVNRLRHSEYIALFESAGFEVLVAYPDRRPVEPAILERLAPPFQAIFGRRPVHTRGVDRSASNQAD